MTVGHVSPAAAEKGGVRLGAMGQAACKREQVQGCIQIFFGPAGRVIPLSLPPNPLLSPPAARTNRIWHDNFRTVRQLFIFLVACVAFVACAAVHAETTGNRMQQSKQIGEFGETLQRSGASLQRLLAIVQGMNSAAATAEQINRSTLALYAYDALGDVDCLLTQVWGMLVMYDAMTHEPDRRRVAPKLLQIRDRTSNDAQRLLDRVETTWLPKLSGSPAGDAITESLRELKKATEMLRAIKL